MEESMRYLYKRIGMLVGRGAVVSVLLTVYAEAFADAAKLGNYECSTDGYYNVVTDPADIPAGYDEAKIKYHRLPQNFCVRRMPNASKSIQENFSKTDFIVIEGAVLKPFKDVIFDPNRYEALVGHFQEQGHNYAGTYSARAENYKNFSGAHPVLIATGAAAAVRYLADKNLYLVDKQTVASGHSSHCPPGYSTVGDSATCYSQKNALKLSDQKKFELVELADLGSFTSKTGETCPLGMAMLTGLGSEKGICTPLDAIMSGVAKMELWGPLGPQSDLVCPRGEYEAGNAICLPQITALYCLMDSKSQEEFDHYSYTANTRQVSYWGTSMIGGGNTRVTLHGSWQFVSPGQLDVSRLRKDYDFFSQDEQVVALSALEGGTLPVLLFSSHKMCNQALVPDGGWSVEPIPSSW